MRSIFIMFIVFISITIFAQDGWYYQTPHGMRDVQFVASNKIVAVGRGIWVSTDIQNNWEGVYPGYDQDIQPSGYNQWLTAVDFPTTSVGYAVGQGPTNVIVKTTDGGYNWEMSEAEFPFDNSSFEDVKFIDSETGFVVGYSYITDYNGIVLKTVDGGDSWKVVLETGRNLPQAIDFIDGGIGWVCGFNNSVYKTTDAGETWINIPLADSIANSHLYGISFIDDQRGIINKNRSNELLRTEDGGENWEIIESGLDGLFGQIQYFDDGTVYTVVIDDSGQRSFYKSSNHGDSWSLVYQSDDTNLSSSFTFFNKDVGIFDGSSSSSSNIKYHITNDGGNTFEEYRPNINNLYFLPNTTKGWGSGYDSHIYRTINGKTWTVNKMQHSEGYKIFTLYSMQFINENKGFAIGSIELNSVTTATKLLQTEDGGVTWSSSELEIYPHGFYFIDETYGWVVGYNGRIYKTLDGGATWGNQESGTTSELYNVFFYDENLGWIVGKDNTLLKTINGGLLWESIDLSAFPNYSLNSITSYGGEICYLEGQSYMLKSADAGNTWSEISKPGNYDSGYNYQKMIPISDTELYVFHSNSSFHSGDGGGTWKEVREYTHSIYPQTWQNIWAASDGILFTENAGVVGIKENDNQEMPFEYYLSQNYPNPFNPSTKINYSIPESGFVTLKIYDMLGREVAELVNSDMNYGNYSVNFNAKNLTSGVYFYRIQSGDFSQTNKMLLIK